MKIIRFNKREWMFILGVFASGLILGSLLFHHANTEDSGNLHAAKDEAALIWTCSMHPQIRRNEPGKCPICGMDLVPLHTDQSDNPIDDPDEIQMTESAMKLADIQTTHVRSGSPEKSIHLLGKVKADERNIVELTARFGGRIESLSVNTTGQSVRKGEILGTLYSPDLISAQKELLEAAIYKETNPAFYHASRNKLKQWDLTDSQIRSIEAGREPRLAFEVLSPISGSVTLRHVSAGEYIKEGSPLFQVIDLTSVWVSFDAYESDLPWIRTNDPVSFTVQSLPGQSFTGRVAQIDPFLNASTRTAQVRVNVANQDLLLKPEMFTQGIILSRIARDSDMLMIPRSSVLWTGKRAIVYVKVPNRETPSFKNREITLGPEAGEFYVVAAGLSEGEEIAAYGVFKIDASAQLAGKRSMMNPESGRTSNGHDHKVVRTMEEMSEQAAPADHSANILHKSFRVSGNCGMCKKRIEKAAMAISGVNSAMWDSEFQALHVNYDSDLVQLQDIHKAVARAGHDTELESAPEAVYNQLPECCKYARE